MYWLLLEMRVGYGMFALSRLLAKGKRSPRGMCELPSTFLILVRANTYANYCVATNDLLIYPASSQPRSLICGVLGVNRSAAAEM